MNLIESFLFFIYVGTVFANLDQKCLTNQNAVGNCVLLKSCPKLFNLFLSKSNENLKIVQDNKCGKTKDNKPLVCCSEDDLNNNSPCLNQNYEYGVCGGLRTCDSLYSMFLNKSQTQLDFISESKCKNSNDQKKLFCCPSSEPPTSLKLNDSCATPNDEDGICQKFTDCKHFVSILEKKPVSVEDYQLFKDSRCGKTSDGIQRVCCPLKGAKTSCINPNYEYGICKGLMTCKPLHSMYTSALDEKLKFVKESKCEDTDNGRKVFCCPTQEKLVEDKTGPSSCQTPQKNPGKCISFKDCPKFKEVGVNKLQIMNDSKCGKTSDNKPLFCCPEDPGSRTVIVPNDSCVTPNIEDGVCKLFTECEQFVSIFDKKPVSEENYQFFKESRCGKTSDGKQKVCCMLPKTTTAKPEPTTTLAKTTTPPTTTLKPFTTTQEVPQACTNPNGKLGSCIRFRDCPHLYKIWLNSPLSEANKKFIRERQCGNAGNVQNVCCVQDDEPEDWLEKLNEMLPPPPLCGGFTKKIVSQKATEIYEYPWTVLLKYVKNSRFHCEGSLINENYVLTAAHCVKKIHPKWRTLSVRLGEWRISTDRDCNDSGVCAPRVLDYEVVEKNVHPNYDEYSNDQHFNIALLRLKSKVKFDGFVMPICLPLDPKLREKNYVMENFEVAGWGKTEYSNGNDTKFGLTVQHVTMEQCKKAYKDTRNINETQICAVVKDKNLCNSSADTGGALMISNYKTRPYYWHQVGVISYGLGDCKTKDVPGVFTKVSTFLKWISETIRD